MLLHHIKNYCKCTILQSGAKVIRIRYCHKIYPLVQVIFCRNMTSAPPYHLVDIGANLTHPTFNNKDLEATIQRANDAGVSKIIITGTCVKYSKEAVRLARLHPHSLYCTAGVHPHDAKTFDDSSLHELENLLEQPECVAVGECGLDFNRNFSPQDTQLRVFETQVELACRIQKPLFIHERDAATEMVEILNKFKGKLPPTVIHCFTGTIDQATTYINMGCYIGLTGFLWKDRLDNGVQAALKAHQLPLERMLIETDSPFMYPNILKNKKLPKEVLGRISEHARNYLHKYCSFKRNEPCSLAATAELIAAFMDVPVDEVALNTTINANKVFNLTS